MKNKLSVAEALQKIKAEEPLEDYEVDFANEKVEALDAMQLNKAGVEVPEERIYYDDADIAYDEAFEGDWIPVDSDGLVETEAGLTTLHLALDPELKAWLAEQPVPAEQLVGQLLQDFHRAQQLLVKQKD